VHPSNGEAGNTLTVCILTFQLNQVTCVLGCVQMDSTHSGHLLLLILVGRSVYNLPPEMCIRSEFMFLSTVIPGPSSLGWNIDVCLQPLIDELAQLWSPGAVTYDISRKKIFLNEGGFDVDYQ